MEWIRRLRVLFHRERLERELEEEMRAHLEMAAREMGDETAARRAFGNPTLLKETSREMWGWRWLEEFSRDVRFAFRMLNKNRGWSAVVVATLALGIGANTAVFSLLDALILRLLPVEEPHRLVRLIDGQSNKLTFPMFDMVRTRAHLLQGVAGTAVHSSQLIEERGEEREAAVQEVSDNYFDLLGVHPWRGRFFRAPEVRTAEGAIAVISETYWRRHYGASPAALGSSFRYMNQDFTVAGVAPPGFRGVVKDTPCDIWVPFDQSVPAGAMLWTKGRWLIPVGRLRPDATGALAAAEVSAILGRRINALQGGNGFSSLRGRLYRPLLALQLMAGLVLAVACANLASLMLARATSRRFEVSLRLAIGAQRGRLVRQLLTESLVVSGFGGALALPVAYWISEALLRFLPPDAAPALADFRLHLDAHLLGFTAALTFLTCLLFGLAPAWRASRAPLIAGMTRSVLGGHGAGGWMSRGLVICEVAMCTLLLITAGLFVRSLRNLRQLDSGFDPEHVVTAKVQSPRTYTRAQWAQRLELLRERAASLPGVRAAAYSHIGLLSGFGINFNVDAEGLPSRPNEYPETFEMRVSPDFFAAMGTPVLRGRDFTDGDEADSPQVAIVNEAFARQFFPGQNSLGRHFGVDGPASSGTIEIVGVVKNTKLTTLREGPPSMYYRPVRQRGIPTAALVVRTTGNLNALAAGLLRAAHDVDARLAVKDVAPFTEVVDRTLLTERLVAHVSSGFGILALLVASIGVYGLLAYGVVRRTREIGIRTALGASRQRVQWLVLRESLLLFGLGLAAGVPTALVATRSVAPMLFGLAPADLATIVAATFVLLGVVLTASYLPARRATKVDPMEALRHE
jgi:predicted permease